MIWVLAQALTSHWRRAPVQAATLVVGLALATALWSAVQAINAEARASYDRAAGALDVAEGVIVTHPSGSVPLADFVRLRRAGVTVVPLIEGEVPRGGQTLSIIGVDLLSRPVPGLSDTGGAEGLAGRGLALVAPETQALLGDDPDLPWLIADETVPPGRMLTDIAVAQRLLGVGPDPTRLTLTDPSQAPRITALAPNLILTDPVPPADAGQLTGSFHLNLTAFGFLSFAVGLFIVHSTVGLAFEQRRIMIRTLRALGAARRHIVTLLAVEMVGLALIAGVLGLILGYLIAGALLPGVGATLRGLYGATVGSELTFRPEWAATGLAMAVVGSGAATASALWRVGRMPLLTAARAEAWAETTRRTQNWQAAGAAMLLTLGALAATQDSLMAGFVAMGGLFLGAALALPSLLDLSLRLATRTTQRPVSQWLWSDSRQQVPGLALALMALLLALSTNIGVGTMVSSFRLTFLDWLDQRLAAELYVSARSDAEGADLARWAMTQPEVQAVLPIRSVERPVAGAPVELYGVIDHATYRNGWPILAGGAEAWAKVYDTGGVLVNEQLARRLDLRLGDPVPLADDWRPIVAGVYADYGNPLGQVVMAMPTLLGQVKDVPNQRFGLRLDPDQAPALAQKLRSAFDLPESAVIDNGSLKAFSRQVFERTFTVTAALSVLTLAVAAFAMFTALLTLAAQRLPQLAPVWALGLTRRHLVRIEVLRALALAALTWVIALPVGLALAWLLLERVNVAAFGWRLPLHLFPWDWALLLGLALGAAVLSAVLPARRLTRISPSEMLKVFADAR